ncbi:hypothetical protein [Nitrosopumilus sp.]|uniref:hypothetical protein n=1 Tax=Nitrosopumilus sp. TaxID=2024843 RepID=UPI0029302C83|nr:hypothetical protein [Nitrosopumilus sp.]
MRNILLCLLLILLIAIPINYSYSQEIGLATFQETAQVLIDKSITQNVTASITLQSTSIQEIKIPSELEQKIREDNRVLSIVLTNQNNCILGVENESCILINVKRDLGDTNFPQIQSSTLEISDQFIDELNEVFDTEAKLHSTLIQTDDKANVALETSGAVSGKGIVSAAYTMPMEDTDSMYAKISSLLIPKEIRDSGGFYDVAKDLATHENSKITFSIIPVEGKSLLQLRLAVNYPQVATEIQEVSPLEFLKVETMDRSSYFSSGFYPLNSIIQVVILSSEDESISNIQGSIVPTRIVDNEKIPTDITKTGWVFDPKEGQRIDGKYIFGEKTSVGKNELKFSLGEETTPPVPVENMGFDESVAVVIIITIVAIAAALFYLKGYTRK